MIYTIGYQKLKDVGELTEILKTHEIEILLDVRSRPYGRKVAFNKKKLIEQLPTNGIRYKWVGEKLGGFASIADADIAKLAKYQEGKSICIMCMEADPENCHRHSQIARRLKAYNVPVHHIVKDKTTGRTGIVNPGK